MRLTITCVVFGLLFPVVVSERLPCVMRRSITAARIPRSAALLVGGTAGSNRNRKIAAPCLTSRRAKVLDLERSPRACITKNKDGCPLRACVGMTEKRRMRA